ncbi:MAG: cytochrome c3 family protein [Desulfurivibrionaceae bacterium]
MKTGPLLLAAVLAIAFLPCSSGGEPKKSGVKAGDCLKCHRSQVMMIKRNGGRHRSDLSCPDCHAGHPPRGPVSTAACSDCHSAGPHYELDDCLQCHTNPHMPLVSLKFPAKPAKKECISCHRQEGGEIRAATSGHGEKSCTYCHNGHGSIPDCVRCHDPHLRGQTMSQCLQCHPAHQPLRITPRPHTPIRFCRPCHAGVTGKLLKTGTRHGSMVCTYCHRGRHPDIPECKDCHGLPHGTRMHRLEQDCLTCHQDPHLLI